MTIQCLDTDTACQVYRTTLQDLHFGLPTVADKKVRFSFACNGKQQNKNTNQMERKC